MRILFCFASDRCFLETPSVGEITVIFTILAKCTVTGEDLRLEEVENVPAYPGRLFVSRSKEINMSTYLVFGATGGTGKHFLPIALGEGHHVKALVRNHARLALQDANLQVQQGSITDAALDFAKLVKGVDFVISMLGDREAQQTANINTAFVKS